MNSRGENKKADAKTINAFRVRELIVSYINDELYKDDVEPLSVFIHKKMNKNYKYLSGLFTKVGGKTIEEVFIQLKIEKLKEMIIENKHSLIELTYLLKFSSPQHLSNLFKKIAGISPNKFRQANVKSNKQNL